MHCEVCDGLQHQYTNCVAQLHAANQHLREAKLGTLQSALSRREVHESLHALIAADTELKAHKAWHIECLTTLPAPETSAAI